MGPSFKIYLCTWFGEDPGHMYVIAESQDRASRQMDVYLDMYIINPVDVKYTRIAGDSEVIVDLCQ